MIAMMHHGLVRHWKWQDKVMGDYIVADWEKHAASMAKAVIRMVFTGHFHANDISEYVSWTDKIYDIETGSTVSYPMPYRMVSLRDGEASVDTRYVKHLPEDYPAELKRACKSLRHYSWKYAYTLDKLGHYLYKDLGVDDNKVTIEW